MPEEFSALTVGALERCPFLFVCHDCLLSLESPKKTTWSSGTVFPRSEDAISAEPLVRRNSGRQRKKKEKKEDTYTGSNKRND